jgi:hypothetical protein
MTTSIQPQPRAPAPHRRRINHIIPSNASVATTLPGHTHHPLSLEYPATRQPDSPTHAAIANAANEAARKILIGIAALL